jgi:hypothetical protein
MSASVTTGISMSTTTISTISVIQTNLIGLNNYCSNYIVLTGIVTLSDYTVGGTSMTFAGPTYAISENCLTTTLSAI